MPAFSSFQVRNNTLLEAIQLDVDPKKWFWCSHAQSHKQFAAVLS
jgi:hypothetical protein